MPKIYQIDSGYSHRFHAYVKNVVGVLGHIRACVMVEAGEGDSPHRNGLDGDKQPNVFANASFNDNVAHQKLAPSIRVVKVQRQDKSGFVALK